ncbi:conserved hypothetical protein [Desulfosarcina cetonica]|nr:conserved hypothetical protein [Desulfosarcina cetonica]
MAVILDFADQNRFGDVMVGHHGGIAAGQVGNGDADDGVLNGRGIGGAGLFNGLDPHVEADEMGFHGIIGDTFVVLDEGQPTLDEGVVGRRVNAHEVIPGGQMAHQRLGIDAGEFFLTHGEGHDRDRLGGHALVAQFFIERHVGIAVDGGDHGGLLAGRAELLDFGDDGLPVGVTERGIVDHDVRRGDALGFQVGLEDLVGRAWIDIVGAGQDPAFDPHVVHQIVHGRDGLLVRRGAGVKDVFGGFLAFVLHRIEKQAVQFLEDRQNRLARHRGPAAEDRGDFLLLDQFAGFFGKQRPVGGRIDHHGFEFFAQQTAFLVLLVNEHQHGIL